MSREIAHAPAQARAAEASPLAREGHEPTFLALVADHAQEPMRQDSAPEERLDLLEHEARQLGARFAADLSEERAPVRVRRLVEDRVLWALTLVRGAARR